METSGLDVEMDWSRSDAITLYYHKTAIFGIEKQRADRELN
jgi:hypothetical protein